jgi:hypothetical protein
MYVLLYERNASEELISVQFAAPQEPQSKPTINMLQGVKMANIAFFFLLRPLVL